MRRRSVRSLFWIILSALSVLVVTTASAQDDIESEGIITYFDSVEKYRAGKADEALVGLKKALRVFQKDGFEKGLFMTHLALAGIYRNQAQYARAVEELKKAAQKAEQDRNTRWKALVLLRMGQLELFRADFDEAEALFLQSLKTLKSVEEVDLAAIVQISLARIFIIRGDYARAEALLTGAERITIAGGHLREAANAMTLQGEIYRLVDNYAQSMKLLDKALKTARKVAFPLLEQEILVQQAVTLADQGSLSQAEKLLKIALVYFNSVSDLRRAARAESLLGDITFRRGRIPEARSELQQAARDFERLGDSYAYARVLVEQGRLLTRVGSLNEAEKVLSKAVAVFTSAKAPYGQMIAWLAMARLQIAQGRLLVASKNAKTASDLAEKIQSISGQAGAALATALVFQASGKDVEALAKFDVALNLNLKLNNAAGQAACLMHGATSLIRLGYLERARKNVEAAGQLPGIDESRATKGQLCLLNGKIDQASGDGSAARADYKKAQAIWSTLGERYREAPVFEALASVATQERNLLEALDYWEQAERIYSDSASPGGVLKCRSAIVDLALDLGNLSRAESVVRRTLRTEHDGSDTSPPLVRFAQLHASSPDSVIVPARYSWSFPRTTRDTDFRLAQYYQYNQNGGQGSIQRGKDPDSQVLKALNTALRARVDLASGDPDNAERSLKGALDVVEKLGAREGVAQCYQILARAYSSRGKYQKALSLLKKAGVPAGWSLSHVKAMALVEAGKLNDSLTVFRETMKTLFALEVREGLWQVSPSEMRRRELFLEDYVDTLLAALSKQTNREQALLAWDVAQTLKMRRILYELASVGATAFPGVDRSILKRVKKQQFAAINASRRARRPSLAKLGKKAPWEKGLRNGDSTGHDPAALLADSRKRFPRYVRFMKGDAPPVDHIKLLLEKNEVYVSILVTRKHIHLFLVGKKAFQHSTVEGEVASVRKEVVGISRDVERPYHLTISPAMNQVWRQLFGPFQSETDAAKVLIVEPDSFLTLFPFEALAPGTFPEAYKEQQEAPLLLDKLFVRRSTSAFRFEAQREKRHSTHPPAVEAYSRPELPHDSGSSSTTDPLDRWLAYWRQPLSRFQSTSLFKGSEQGLAVTKIFGKAGKLVEGEHATCSAFLKRDPEKYSMVHLLCPVLLPPIPAGRVQQPVIVFSGEQGDPAGGLCDLSHIMEDYSPARLGTLAWLGWHKPDPYRGLTLLVEALGFMGVRQVILPLWPADRRGEAEADEFMIGLYRAIKAGDDVEKAFTKARKALLPTSSRKNRCNTARFALF